MPISRRNFLKSMSTAAVAGMGLSHVPHMFASARRQDLPRLIYYYAGTPQPDVQMVQDALSEYMAERIGATIELRTLDWGVFNDQIGLINTSAEVYDLMFTAPWINNYYTNVDQEYLLPLDDLLPELAPGYWASMTPETWEAARVQGSIYAGINQQIFVKPFGLTIRSDVLDAIGAAEDYAKVTNYMELEPIMQALYEYVEQDDTLTYVTYSVGDVAGINEIWGYDPQEGGLAVRSTDESAQVVLFAETDEFAQALELTRKWYMDGYVYPDLLEGDEYTRAWEAGQFPLRMAEVQKPGGEAEVKARWGWEVVGRAIAEPLLTTGSVTATLNGVSSTSANPELAVQFLELLNTDPVFYNMLGKGIQGVHWDWADEGQLLIKPPEGKESFTEVGWNPNTDWMFGNVFNSYYSDPTQIGAWPATADLNRNARPSPVLGFTFNRSNVDTELASVTAVGEEYAEPLLNGLIDPAEGLPKYIQALKDAGVERIQEEMQSQIDAWKAEQA